MAPAPRVALVSREAYPMGGGGIGQFVSAAADLLSQVAEVTVVTSGSLRRAYERLRDSHDARLPDPAVRFAFVEEPEADATSAWLHPMQLYGHRVLEVLRALYGDSGPDLIEFADFLAEGFVTLQAAAACDPFLERTRVLVRMHTTAEICEVLNGSLPDDAATQSLHDMERYCLAHADRVIWQGGDILSLYRRLYGEANLAPAVRIRYPYRGPVVSPDADQQYRPPGPLRVLYAGRMERRKGVHNLIRASTALPEADFRLTCHGADTTKAALETSMAEQLRLLIADEAAVKLGEPLDREALSVAIRAHDVVVIPSLWECWPYVALESMHLNRPVLATPVGGLTEMLRPGSGWLTSGTGPADLGAGLEHLIHCREDLQEAIRRGEPRRRAAELASDEEILDAYRTLLADPPARHAAPQARGRRPLISAVVLAGRSAVHLRTTVQSLDVQTYRPVEVIVVVDEPTDAVIAEAGVLTSKHPVRVVLGGASGASDALNLGVGHARGKYVLILEPGWAAAATLISRATDLLERRRELAYVSSWLQSATGAGAAAAAENQPLGNEFPWRGRVSRAGSAGAIYRRRLFEVGYRFELPERPHWGLHRALAEGGHCGTVIPERLLVPGGGGAGGGGASALDDLTESRLLGELEAMSATASLEWTAPGYGWATKLTRRAA